MHVRLLLEADLALISVAWRKTSVLCSYPELYTGMEVIGSSQMYGFPLVWSGAETGFRRGGCAADVHEHIKSVRVVSREWGLSEASPTSWQASKVSLRLNVGEHVRAIHAASVGTASRDCLCNE